MWHELSHVHASEDPPWFLGFLVSALKTGGMPVVFYALHTAISLTRLSPRCTAAYLEINQYSVFLQDNCSLLCYLASTAECPPKGPGSVHRLASIQMLNTLCNPLQKPPEEITAR